MTIDFSLLSYLQQVDSSKSIKQRNARQLEENLTALIPASWSEFTIQDLQECSRQFQRIERVVQLTSLKVRIQSATAHINSECEKYNQRLTQDNLEGAELINFSIRVFQDPRFAGYTEDKRNQLINRVALEIKKQWYSQRLVQRLAHAAKDCDSLHFTVEYSVSCREVVSVFSLVGCLKEYMITLLNMPMRDRTQRLINIDADTTTLRKAYSDFIKSGTFEYADLHYAELFKAIQYLKGVSYDVVSMENLFYEKFIAHLKGASNWDSEEIQAAIFLLESSGHGKKVLLLESLLRENIEMHDKREFLNGRVTFGNLPYWLEENLYVNYELLFDFFKDIEDFDFSAFPEYLRKRLEFQQKHFKLFQYPFSNRRNILDFFLNVDDFTKSDLLNRDFPSTSYFCSIFKFLIVNNLVNEQSTRMFCNQFNWFDKEDLLRSKDLVRLITEVCIKQSDESFRRNILEIYESINDHVRFKKEFEIIKRKLFQHFYEDKIDIIEECYDF